MFIQRNWLMKSLSVLIKTVVCLSKRLIACSTNYVLIKCSTSKVFPRAGHLFDNRPPYTQVLCFFVLQSSQVPSRFFSPIIIATCICRSVTVTSFQRCCDPLKCHTRRRTRNTRSDLRPVSSNLVACFLLLMLSLSHKICSMCRRKLYVMQNTSSSALHLSDSIPQHSTEKSSWADTSFLIQGVVDHEGHDQLTDAEGSIELPDEACNLNKTTRCTDEDGRAPV